MNTGQLIHISSEIIVLLSFTYYLQRQITKLSGVYTELKQRIDETEQLNNKRFDMLLNMIEDNIAQQVQYNRMTNFMPSMGMSSQQHMNNQHTEDVGLRNRKTKRTEPTPNNKPSAEPMRLNKKSDQTPTQQNVSQQQPQQQSNLFPFNPLELLNSISGMSSSPVFSATIVTDNIVPQAQKNSDIKIVEIEEDEESPEKLDEDIQEELKDLLSNEDNSASSTEEGEKAD